jgi:hypothetical protein
VVWARADRVYIASPDSAAIEPGDLLTFMQRRKKIASGEVTQVLTPDLAIARLTSGSLDRVSKLDRVRIVAERPPMRAMPVLRIGCPGGERSSLLFDCKRGAVRPPLGGGAYRTDSLAPDSYRLVRVGGLPAGAPWPDTITVRRFGEVADEEIALERGEIDLAVFWPGEPSAHVRTGPRWQGLGFGSRSRGVLAAFAADEPRALAALNDELFRGDLEPWPDPAGTQPAIDAPPRSLPAARVVVDPACPGRLLIERFLNRPAPDAAEKRPAVRLFYLDSPVAAPDSIARDVLRYLRDGSFAQELRARIDSLEPEILRLAAARDPGNAGRLGPVLRDSLGVTLLFAIRCPLVCEPGLRRYLRALGPDAFADMLECRRAGAAP